MEKMSEVSANQYNSSQYNYEVNSTLSHKFSSKANSEQDRMGKSGYSKAF